MQHRELERILRQTLDDRRLSRSERRALSDVIAEADPSAEERAGYLGRAFAMAEEAMSRQADREVLEWLLAVAKTVATPTGPKAVPRRGEIAEALFEPRQNCPARLRSLIDGCLSGLDVCVFTITDNSLTRAVLAAHRRRVKVRIVTDDLKSLDRGSDVMRLRDAGIEVRFDADPNHMHHKFALFDRRLVVTGSYNWTRGAAEGNHENIVVTDDQGLVEQFGEEFDRLWEVFAPRLSGDRERVP